MSRRNSLSLLALLVAACADDPPPIEVSEEEIRNGTPEHLFEESVFAVFPRTCTSVNIRYPRCLMTARHCLPTGRFLQGQNVTGPSTATRQQPTDRERAHPGPSTGIHPDLYPSTYNEWTDLGVVWLKNLQPGAQARIVSPDGYTPLNLIVPAAGKVLGLTSVSFGHTSAISEPAVVARIVGYGQRTDNDATWGRRRSGYAKITSYHQGSWQGPWQGEGGPLLGSVLRVEPGESDQLGCAGDSGGPLFVGGGRRSDPRVAGILSTGHGGEACTDGDFDSYSAFDDDPIAGGESNFDWSDRTMEELCTKTLYVRIEGSGTVGGTLAPLQRLPLGLVNNSQIQCPGDCEENFHAKASDGVAAQAIDIVAAPAPGWHFSHWKSEQNPRRKCQCDGSGDPTCHVDEAPMGFYSEMESIDLDVCIAVFEQDACCDGGVPDAGTPQDAWTPPQDAWTPPQDAPTSGDAG
jgi:hypothetical protein